MDNQLPWNWIFLGNPVFEFSNSRKLTSNLDLGVLSLQKGKSGTISYCWYWKPIKEKVHFILILPSGRGWWFSYYSYLLVIPEPLPCSGHCTGGLHFLLNNIDQLPNYFDQLPKYFDRCPAILMSCPTVSSHILLSLLPWQSKLCLLIFKATGM